MFQYTNTIVLNSLKDVTTGLDKIVKGSDNIEVRRVNKFLKKNVSAMHKRTASDPVIGKAEFTITNPGVGIYRLKLYIRTHTTLMTSYSKVSLLFMSSESPLVPPLQLMLLKKLKELLIRFRLSTVINTSELRLKAIS